MTQPLIRRRNNDEPPEIEAIIGIGADGSIIFATPDAERVFGYQSATLIGVPVSDLLPEGIPSWSDDAPGVSGPPVSRHIVMGRRSDGAELPLTATTARAAAGAEGVTIVRLSVTDPSTQQDRTADVPWDRGEALAALGARAVAGAALHELYEEAAETLKQGVAAEFTAVLEYTDIPYLNLYQAGTGWTDPPALGSDIQMDPSLSPVGPDAPVVLGDLDAAGLLSPSDLLLTNGVAGVLAVAVQGARGVHGALAAYVSAPREFQAADVSFAQSVANILSSALLRQRAEHALQSESLERAILSSISRKVAAAPEFGIALDHLTADLSRLVEFDVITIRLANEPKNELTLSHLAGPLAGILRFSAKARLEGSFEQRVMRQSRVIRLGRSFAGRPEGAEAILRQAQDGTRWTQGGARGTQHGAPQYGSAPRRQHPGTGETQDGALSEWRAQGIRSLMGVPLVVAGVSTGVMVVGSTRDDAYSERHAAIMERLAPVVAGAAASSGRGGWLPPDAPPDDGPSPSGQPTPPAPTIAAPEPSDGPSPREYELSVLAELSRIAAESPDLESLLEIVSHSLAQLVQFDRVVIALLSEDGARLRRELVGGAHVPGIERGSEAVVDAGLLRQIEHGGIETGEAAKASLGPDSSDVVLRSSARVPLKLGDRLLGGIVLRSKDATAYTEKELTLLRRAAAQVAPLIEATRALERVRREADENYTLARISRVANSAAGFKRVQSQVGELIHRLVPFDRLVAARIDAKAGKAEVLWAEGADVPEMPAGAAIPADRLVEGGVLPERARITDLATARGFRGADRLRAAGLSSQLATPIIFNGALLGVLVFYSATPDAFQSRHQDLAEAISAQLAGVFVPPVPEPVEQPAPAPQPAAGTADSTLAREHDVLAEIGRIVTSSLNVSEFQHQFAAQVQRLIPFDSIELSRVDPRTGALKNLSVSGGEMADAPADWRETVDEALTDTRTAAVVTTDDPAVDGQAVQAAREAGMRSVIVAPVVWDDRIIGTLACYSTSPDAYTPDHLAAANSICTQIAGALENTLLLRELQREAQVNTVLVEIGRTVTSSSDISEVYERFAELAKDLIPFDRLVVSRLEPDRRTMVSLHVHGTPLPSRRDETEVPLGQLVDERVATSKESFIVDLGALANAGNRAAKTAVEAGLASMLHAPFIWQDRIVGGIDFYCDRPGAYVEEHRRLAERVAAQVSGGLMNAQLRAAAVEAEASMRASQARLKTVLSNAPVAVAALDRDGVCVLLEGRALAAFNLNPEEIIGRSVFEFTGRTPALENEVRQGLKGVSGRNELKLAGRHIDLWVQPVMEPDGAVGGVMLVATDVTERARAESARAKVRQLRHSQAERTRFLSTVSHEMRTPLTSIVALTDIMMQNGGGNLEEDQVRNLKVIQRNADRLNNLISDLLDLSRMEAGSFTLQKSAIDVEEMLREVEESFRPVTSARSQKLVVQGVDEPVSLTADQERLSQVMTNLLSNASKYSPEGTTVTLSASVLGEELLISVADEGPGIPEEHRERVFQAFYRIENAQTDAVPGTGLGLAIVKRIIDLHDGGVQLDSEPGKGTTVTIFVPGVVRRE